MQSLDLIFAPKKSKAFTIFKSFKAYVEKEVCTYITYSRAYRGCEFTSSEFVEFCTNQGISRKLTAAYTPQQNGVSKRTN